MVECRAKKNPFFHGRLEEERNPTLFVPDGITRWGSRKSILFEGGRGSGKSSTLRLLTWDVTWGVSNIRLCGSSSALSFMESPTYIGLYHRVEDIGVPLWERWQVAQNNPDMAQRYFATFLEFLYIDLFLNALNGIRRKGRTFFVDRSAEQELTSILLRECFPKKDRPQLLNLSFTSLREIIAEVHRGIRQLVFQDTSEEEIKATYSVVGPGDLLKQAGRQFQKCYSTEGERTILVLLDDCNFLTKWQTVVVNTAVANCEGPISYKLSTLAGMYPTFDTMDRQRPVVLDNIDVVRLPSESSHIPVRKNGAKGLLDLTFADQVCKARIIDYCGEEYASKFDFKELLGSFDLEAALEKKLAMSENDEAFSLLKKAREPKETDGLPKITGVWLLEKQVRDYELRREVSTDLLKRRKRQVSSVYFKKWNYVAGVALCREFNLDFPYFGQNVVLYLSWNSIREMLRIMSMIWDEAGGEINEFLKQRPIIQKIQTNGIVKAAESRYGVIDSKTVISESGSTLQRVCDRLGNLFLKCQSYPYIQTTPETASISVSSKAIDDDEEVQDIVRKGVVSGWLLRRVSGNRTYVGLHPILAPKFGISFRNPFFYPEPVSSVNLRSLFLGGDAEARKVEKEILDKRLARYEKRHKEKGKSNEAL